MKIVPKGKNEPELILEADLHQHGNGVVLMVGGYAVLKVSQEGIEVIGAIPESLGLPLDSSGYRVKVSNYNPI